MQRKCCKSWCRLTEEENRIQAHDITPNTYSYDEPMLRVWTIDIVKKGKQSKKSDQSEQSRQSQQSKQSKESEFSAHSK